MPRSIFNPGSHSRFNAGGALPQPLRWVSSLLIAATFLALAYAPVPGLRQTLVVVSGSELKEALEDLEVKFEQQYRDIDLQLEIQGSQDMVDRYGAGTNDFTATVLIPADGQLLTELERQWQVQNPQGKPLFATEPQPIAKTLLVGVVWPDRGQQLFPQGRFQWQQLDAVLAGDRRWEAVGGPPEWGSVDLLITDPSRSNSGQLSLSLWLQSRLGQDTLDAASLSTTPAQTLLSQLKTALYQPAPSTDTLLQQFITQGPNNADLALVYESIALHRWSQAQVNPGRSYQIYYLDPTLETVATGVVLRPGNGGGQVRAGRSFLQFLQEPAQQQVFATYGFRPVDRNFDLTAVPNSPWAANIPGAQPLPSGRIGAAPDAATRAALVQAWQQVR
ncbi:MAG: substrate-binding domain-containing protein [Prochlorothrix sp.]